MSRRLDPVEEWQRDIEHRNIRFVLERKLDGLAAVTRLGTHDKVGARLQQRTQTAPDNQVIIGKDDTDHAPPQRKPQPILDQCNL